MTITSHITETDYRAMQWRIMVHRAKFPWIIGGCLSLSTLFYWFSIGAEKSVALTLGIVAAGLFIVGAGLLVMMIGLHFSRNKPLWGKRMPLGQHTFEFTGSSIIVSNDQSRAEVQIAGIYSVDEGKEYFFVVLRKGADLIIPRRGLDRQRLEGLQSFREVVALSSLHVDALERRQMTPEKASLSFNLLRWASLPFAIAVAFTFGQGPASPRLLVLAVVFGACFLGTSLISWRTREHGWLAFGFVGLLVLRPGVVDPSGVRLPDAHFYQCLCLTFIMAGLPLLLFPRFFRRLARLDEAPKDSGS